MVNVKNLKNTFKKKYLQIILSNLCLNNIICTYIQTRSEGYILFYNLFSLKKWFKIVLISSSYVYSIKRVIESVNSVGLFG